MSHAAAHQDQRHKTGNHSNPERFHRITVQRVELDPPRIGDTDLVDRQLHRHAQRPHPRGDPPMAHGGRQRDHRETDKLNDPTRATQCLPAQQRCDEQQQRDHKSGDIDDSERARNDRSGYLAGVRQAKRSHHAKRRRCDDRAKEKRCSQPGRQQSESCEIKYDPDPF